MKKFLIPLTIFLIILSGCKTRTPEVTKDLIPKYFKHQIVQYDSYNSKYLYDYYSAYLKNNSYIYALNLVNHPDFLTNSKKYKSYSQDNLMLVNKNFYLEENTKINNLVKISNIKYIKRPNEEMLINQEVLTNLLEMEKFAETKNINLTIFSAYRTYQKQVSLWSNRSYQDSLFLALPGHSEHQSGLAIDIGCLETGLTIHFENTQTFKFLDTYASEFGFILRYPKNKTHITGYAYEAWHYRYVGKIAARIIKEQNLTLEEYLYQYTLLPLNFAP